MFDVRSFGALGNDEADDTEAIQAAMDEARGANGGVVYFPPGTYLSRQLVVHDHVTLRGESPTAVVKVHPTFPARADTLFYPSRRGAITPNRNVTFESLTIDGNHRTLGDRSPAYLILLAPAEQCVVRFCTLRDFTQYAIGIIDNVASDPRERVGSRDNVVVGNRIEGRLGPDARTSVAGVAVSSQLPFDPPVPPDYGTHRPVTQRTLIAHNDISGGRYALTVYNAAHSQIIGNRCTDQTARNIIAAWGSSHTTIANNICRLAPGSGIGIGGDHITVTGNVIEDTIENPRSKGVGGEGNGINFYGDWEHLTIANNTVRRTSHAGVFLGRGTRHVSVSGNVMEECGRFGIRLEQARIGRGWPPDRKNFGITIIGNTVDSTHTAYSVGPGDNVTVRATDIMLIGNVAGPACQRALLLQDTDNVVLEGNDWAGRVITLLGTNSFRSTQTSPIDIQGELRIAGSQVLGARKRGWQMPTGSASRSTFDTNSVSLRELARRVKGLIDDLSAHGLIGR